MNSPERYPDLEIYLKRVPAADLLAWLETLFTDVQVSAQEQTTQCLINQMECTISGNVAKGGDTSLWFKSNETPWSTDVECARAAFAQFGGEVRCSTGGWEGESEEETGGWLRITEKGEQTVNWRAA